MVEINKQTDEIKITLKGDLGTLFSMQASIINCIKYYNFNDYPAQTGEFIWLLELLEAMLPTEEQQERVFDKEKRHIKLPENLSEGQKVKIIEAFNLIEKGDEATSTNPIVLALKIQTDLKSNR